MSQGYRNDAETMRDNDGVFPPECHDADDDIGADPDDTADIVDTADPAAATAGNRFMAFGEQGPGRYGNADTTQPGIFERQCLH